MFSFLNQIPQVTKNLLILNVLMFILQYFFATQQVDLTGMLSGHYVNSPLFQPYQIVSHFFLHGDLMHIFFNMFALLMFGSALERLWGAKRFFLVYVGSAIGAFALYNGFGVFEIMEAKRALSGQVDFTIIDELLKSTNNQMERLNLVNNYLHTLDKPVDIPHLETYFSNATSEMVGASGAVFGLLAAFAILFPNTELMIMFFPVPIKAKYLIGGYVVLELLLSFYRVEGDNVAHLAHVGGAIIGAVFVLIWRRNRTHFY